MIQVQDAHLTTDAFQLKLLSDGIVQLSFGPTHICMTFDAAYDLQFRLAGFLASSELGEFPPDDEIAEDPRLLESKKNLLHLANFARQKPKKLDG
jgi:hypothetical protein